MFLLDLHSISQTLFYRSWFPRSLQSPFLLLFLLEAIPLESDTRVFPMELAFKAWESECIWKPTQHSPLPLNCYVFQSSSHIPLPVTFQSNRSIRQPVFIELPMEGARACWSMPIKENLPPAKQTSGKSLTTAAHRPGSNQQAIRCQYVGLK